MFNLLQVLGNVLDYGLYEVGLWKNNYECEHKYKFEFIN